MAKPRTPKKNSVVNEVATPVRTASPITESATAVAEPEVPVTAAEDNKSAVRKATKKPEIVRTDSRANLVPINIEDEIRRLAYLYSERRGFEPGHETEDWLTAEREVRQRYHQQTA